MRWERRQSLRVAVVRDSARRTGHSHQAGHRDQVNLSTRERSAATRPGCRGGRTPTAVRRPRRPPRAAPVPPSAGHTPTRQSRRRSQCSPASALAGDRGVAFQRRCCQRDPRRRCGEQPFPARQLHQQKRHRAMGGMRERAQHHAMRYATNREPRSRQVKMAMQCATCLVRAAALVEKLGMWFIMLYSNGYRVTDESTSPGLSSRHISLCEFQRCPAPRTPRARSGHFGCGDRPPYFDRPAKAFGFGILDFERPPATSHKRARLATVLSVLKRSGCLELSPAARCTLVSSDAKAGGFDDRTGHGESHAADQSHEDHHRADFSAQQNCRCTVPTALAEIGVRLRDIFEGLHEFIVNAATEEEQGRTVVTRCNMRVRFGK